MQGSLRSRESRIGTRAFHGPGEAGRGIFRSVDKNAGASFRVALHRAMGCYIARVLELPGCVCRGDTEVEAVEMARAAIRAHLQVARALEGDPATVHVLIRV